MKSVVSAFAELIGLLSGGQTFKEMNTKNRQDAIQQHAFTTASDGARP